MKNKKNKKNTNVQPKHYLSWFNHENDLKCQRITPDVAGLIIGSSDHTDIKLSNEKIAKKHVLIIQQDCYLRITDLGSKYGTWINNKKLEPNQPYVLEGRTCIRLGQTGIWYEQGSINNEIKNNALQPSQSLQLNYEIQQSKNINEFKVRILNILQQSIFENTFNSQVIKSIDRELNHLIELQQKKMDEQSLLDNIRRQLSDKLTTSEILETAFSLIGKEMDSDRGFIMCLDDDEHVFEASFGINVLKWSKSGEPKAFSQILIQRCLEQGKPLVIEDTTNSEKITDLINYPFGGGRSIAVIPFNNRNHVKGVFYLDHKKNANHFHNDQLPLLNMFSEEINIALHNNVLYTKSITDDLTQLYTKQHVNEAISFEMKRAQRYQTELSIIVLDLDFFKQINDTFGHVMGDSVLIDFATILTSHIRDCDLIGRIGGEEFIIILPNTDIKGAYVFGERIRKATVDYKFGDSNQNLSVTVSVGAASYKSKYAGNIELFIDAADKALYYAKKQGRNQTMMFNSFK